MVALPHGAPGGRGVGAATGAGMARVKLVVDTDPGVDDAMALLMAFADAAGVELLGLTTIYGNVPTARAAQNALALCELAGRGGEVPVAVGAHGSSRGALKERIADFVHGADGFGNSDHPPPQGKPIAQSAAQFICEQAERHPGEVVLLMLGACTNLALAMQWDPSLAQKLKRVVILGGAFNINGNVNPAAEANIFGDPEAADYVLSSGANVDLVPLDATHSCIFSAAQREGLLSSPYPWGGWLHRITDFYLGYHRRAYDLDGFYLHDPAAYTAVLRPELFSWHSGAVRVCCDDGSIMRAKTMLDMGVKEWMGENPWTGRPKVRVALSCDGAAVSEYVHKCLCPPADKED